MHLAPLEDDVLLGDAAEMMHLVRGPEVLLLHSRVRHARPPGEPGRWAGSQTKGSSSTSRPCPNGGVAGVGCRVTASSRVPIHRPAAGPRSRWIRGAVDRSNDSAVAGTPFAVARAAGCACFGPD